MERCGVWPGGGLGLWLRYTVLTPPGQAPKGALWCTLFDAAAPGPVAVKQELEAARLAVPGGGYIGIGESRLTPHRATGSAAAACSPQPATRATGEVTVDGRRVELDGWPAMVGHNWGVQHAERWVWLHATFGGGAWLDVAIARVRLGRWLSPWIATGALSLDGVRHPLGGPGRWRATSVAETPEGCRFELPGDGGLGLRGLVGAAGKDFVGWVYADPADGTHDTLNCSIATMELTVRRGGRSRTLHCAGGAAYELGTRDRDHGVPLQPFADGPVVPER